MTNRFEAQKLDVIENKRVRTRLNPGNSRTNSTATSEVIDLLKAEGGESLYNYVDFLGLVNDPNLIVLSSMRHYYYEEEDLKDVNTIVNLKQLNQIKNLNSLFRTIFNIFPPKSNFIGSFAENYKHREFFINNSSSADGSDDNSDALENGIISKIPFLNMIYNFMDSKTNRYMTRKDVNFLFETHGFKILDMTELNGYTYFLAQKVQVFVE
jgi:hypothetical protein